MAKRKKNQFKCKNCEKTIETAPESGFPECCGTPMDKLEDPPPCQMSSTAEHARPDEMAEPCDDGREGKIRR